MEKEIWRAVVGYEGLYEVSNFGRIFSYVSNKVLKDRIDKKGYNNVCLKGRKFFKVSHIVAMAFPEICGEWFEGAEVDHLNGKRADNRPENLKVCTHIQNIKNPLTIERYKNRPGIQIRKQQEDCKKRITINGKDFSSQREAANYFGVSDGHISAIKHGRYKDPEIKIEMSIR